MFAAPRLGPNRTLTKGWSRMILGFEILAAHALFLGMVALFTSDEE